MTATNDDRKGRRLLVAALLLLLVGFLALWWFKLHQPWLRNRAFQSYGNGFGPVEELSIERRNVLPASFVRFVGMPRYFSRVAAVRGHNASPNFRSFRKLEELKSCSMNFDPNKSPADFGYPSFEFVDCPKLEMVSLAGASKLRIENCPALKELHLVWCEIDVEELDLPESVEVFVTERPDP